MTGPRGRTPQAVSSRASASWFPIWPGWRIPAHLRWKTYKLKSQSLSSTHRNHMRTANQVACPRCTAFAGQRCLSKKGAPRSQFHKERITAASRTNVQKLRPEQDDDLTARISRSKTASWIYTADQRGWARITRVNKRCH